MGRIGWPSRLEDSALTEHIDAASQAAAAQAPGARAKAGGETAGDALLSLILSSLEEDKAEDVVAIALAGKSEMADHMVIASGRSSRQVVSLAEKLAEKVKAFTGQPARAEGKESGDWVLVDCGDVICHLFRPEVRDFYQLEKMWMPVSAGAAQG